MYIRNYQIYNVLNVYQKQLTQHIEGYKENRIQPKKVASNLNFKGNRQSVIDKIKLNILRKIDFLEISSNPTDHLRIKKKNESEQDNSHYNRKTDKLFFFNVIGQDNQKTEDSIEIDKSNGLNKNKNYQ